MIFQYYLQNVQNIYDDYKFITKHELTELGLEHLEGTNLLRAYMHGYVQIRKSSSFIHFKYIINIFASTVSSLMFVYIIKRERSLNHSHLKNIAKRKFDNKLTPIVLVVLRLTPIYHLSIKSWL